MLNYENITKSMPRKLANILANYDISTVVNEFCRNCQKSGECPIAETGECPHSNAEMVLWWLNQEAR